VSRLRARLERIEARAKPKREGRTEVWSETTPGRFRLHHDPAVVLTREELTARPNPSGALRIVVHRIDTTPPPATVALPHNGRDP